MRPWKWLPLTLVCVHILQADFVDEVLFVIHNEQCVALALLPELAAGLPLEMLSTKNSIKIHSFLRTLSIFPMKATMFS
jgi:hypothetical protein